MHRLKRRASQRSRKWYKKVDPVTYARILSQVKDLAYQDFSEYQPIHEEIIRIVKGTLENYPTEYPLTHGYVWYAQGIWYAVNKFGGQTRQKMADATFLYWYKMGLKEAPMREIAAKLGVEISPWEALVPIRGITMEDVYRGTKRALKETLERVETDLTDVELYYDANGNLVKVVKTDKITGVKKQITLTYDAQGNLVKKEEEYL